MRKQKRDVSSIFLFISAKGREILLNTKDLVERLNYQVIYGDTDSIMINTNVLDYDQVFAVGKKVIERKANGRDYYIELESINSYLVFRNNFR